MKYAKKLIGESVYLSPVSEEDEVIFYKWMNDFDVTDYIGRSYSNVTLLSEKEWIHSATKGDKYVFSIVSIENDELIGNIELMNIKFTDRSAIIGIFIGNDNDRNKGYGTESLNLLLDFAFNYLNLNSISLTVLDVNQRAQCCYKKVGFKETGKMRQARYINGTYHDVICMDILKSEFTGSFIKNKNL